MRKKNCYIKKVRYKNERLKNSTFVIYSKKKIKYLFLFVDLISFTLSTIKYGFYEVEKQLTLF